MASCGELWRCQEGPRAVAGRPCRCQDGQVNVRPRLSVPELLQAPHRGEALVLERDRQRRHATRRRGRSPARLLDVEALLEQPLDHRDRSAHRGKVERRVALGGAPGVHDGWALHEQPLGLIEVSRLRGLEEALVQRVHLPRELSRGPRHDCRLRV